MSLRMKEAKRGSAMRAVLEARENCKIIQQINGLINRVLKPSLVQKSTRTRLYQIIARPVLCYGSEAWTIRTKDESRLTACEMRFMRRTLNGIERKMKISFKNLMCHQYWTYLQLSVKLEGTRLKNGILRYYEVELKLRGFYPASELESGVAEWIKRQHVELKTQVRVTVPERIFSSPPILRNTVTQNFCTEISYTFFIRLFYDAVSTSRKEIGLEVNPEKTNYMIMSRDENIVLNGNIIIGNLSFEEVEKFKYLGATVTNINDTREEIKHRINMRNACYYSVEKLLSSSLLSKNLKVRIYKTVILPAVLYGCETWTLTLREEQRLRVFENKVLRKRFGPKSDDFLFC
ncbi:hypothetical protein ANN_26473 [Periplaneta americana]|uniref:Reverse transcriptase domain-containing protein n=1 Tax=Periplaneta americana TaxID=6978 RepID=A0ABQ8RYP8_PERAM|nr:hypothetical protein ANN_26473 [Periplaneta americana]